jgi:DnaJ-class molecular chaperone
MNPSGQNVAPPALDMSKLLGSVQQIMQQNANGSKKFEEMNPQEMLNYATESVFSVLDKDGKLMDENAKNSLKMLTRTMFSGDMFADDSVKPVENSRIHLDQGQESEPSQGSMQLKVPKENNQFEELDSDSEVDEIQPRTRSIRHDLHVTLDDLYKGNSKKIAVSRKRIVKGTNKIKEEKIKLEIPIIPGMKDRQEIRFNHQGNEEFGSDTGDIVITLCANEHEYLHRMGDNLYTVKNISLYESYAAAKGLINVVVQHFDTYLILESDGRPLHVGDGIRKVRLGGMPIMKTRKERKGPAYGNLYIRFHVILPEQFDDFEKSIGILETMFPIIPNNKNNTVFRDIKTKKILNKGFEPGSSKVNRVMLEEVSEEEMAQLEHDDDLEEEERDREDQEEEN